MFRLIAKDCKHGGDVWQADQASKRAVTEDYPQLLNSFLLSRGGVLSERIAMSDQQLGAA